MVSSSEPGLSDLMCNFSGSSFSKSSPLKVGLHVGRKHKHKQKLRVNKHKRKKKERALALVLASSRFTRVLCLCLRRACKPALTRHVLKSIQVLYAVR